MDSKLTERLKEIQMRQQQQNVENKSHVDDQLISLEDDLNEFELENNINDDTLTFTDDELNEITDSIDPDEDYVDDELKDIEDALNEPEPVIEEPKMSVKERAELASQKYAPITVKEETNNEPEEDRDVAVDLFAGLEDIERENKEISEHLQAIQNETTNEELVSEESTEQDDSDIDDIILSMGEDVEKQEKEEEEDLEEILKKYEDQKFYATIEPNEEVTGPADYIIETDETYEDNIEDILRSNNIVFTKKNNREKTAILDRFVNSGDKVSVALPNSGIYVTMSGAGTAEIIAMNNMSSSESETRQELDKLNHLSQHIVGSSIGKMKLSQLIKVVSYWDKDTLYYALFAATHPAVSELSKICDRCGEEYFMNIHTKDLLLNPEDFEKRSNDIRDNVTTYARLLETSQLGKVYKKAHSNGMIIYYKHPSIESYLTTSKNLTQETIEKHSGLVDIVYSIDKIALHDKGNSFIEIKDPNEIIELISKFRNASEKYEIFDMLENIRPSANPTYGFKKNVCPHCGYKNPASTFSMESILFTQAQREEWLESIRWAVRTQKRRKSEKN